MQSFTSIKLPQAPVEQLCVMNHQLALFLQLPNRTFHVFWTGHKIDPSKIDRSGPFVTSHRAGFNGNSGAHRSGKIFLFFICVFADRTETKSNLRYVRPSSPFESHRHIVSESKATFTAIGSKKDTFTYIYIHLHEARLQRGAAAR